jgi:predicted transcriptional regulator
MPQRRLTITMSPHWKDLLRAQAGAFSASGYRGETLNFESPAAFFSQLTERRWALLQLLIGAGELGLRETARRAGRDVKRVSEDVDTLVNLGLLERTISGGVCCPFNEIHVDLHLTEKTKQAA